MLTRTESSRIKSWCQNVKCSRILKWKLVSGRPCTYGSSPIFFFCKTFGPSSHRCTCECVHDIHPSIHIALRSGGGWNHRQGGCFLLFFLPPPLSSASLPSFLFSSLLSSNFHGAHGGRGRGLSPPCPHAKSAPAYTCDRGVYLDHPYISRFVLKYNFRYILRAIYSTGTKQGLTSMPQFSHQYPYDTSGHK